VLLGLQCWTFIVRGFRIRLCFFFRTRGEVFQRNRRFIVTIRSSACSTAANLIVSSRRLAHAVSEMKSKFNRRDFHEVPFDDDYSPGHDRHGGCDVAAR
jgi:hypothetical protein